MKPSLRVIDIVSLVIGIVIGTAIFKMPPMVFGAVTSPAEGLAVWGVGAAIALSGGLCYCELASAYPQYGAEYVYLARAYGHRVGFLFAWVQLLIVITGSIGAMAFVFADYFCHEVPILAGWDALLAAGAISLLTLLHLRGVTTGVLIQNGLTLAKIVALAMILLAGFAAPSQLAFTNIDATSAEANYGLALVFVLYVFGGWNDVATLTPEVNSPQRNMPRGLLIGLGIVTGVYLLLNLAYLNGLGFIGLRDSSAPAADLVVAGFGPHWSPLISIAVMVSSLGAIHGMLFTASRMLLAVASDYSRFSCFRWVSTQQVPVPALMMLMGISLVLVFCVGTEVGRSWLDGCLRLVSIPPPNWKQYQGGFDTLFAATAPFFWAFFALSGVAVILLRYQDRSHPRPFRTPLYPVPPLVFIAASLFMLWSALNYARTLTLFVVPVLLGGVLVACTQQLAADHQDSN